jgi:hypothetical protein
MQDPYCTTLGTNPHDIACVGLPDIVTEIRKIPGAYLEHLVVGCYIDPFKWLIVEEVGWWLDG